MLKRNFRLFTVKSIPVEVNATWIIVLVLVTWSFATGFYPESYPGLFSGAALWVLAFLTAMLLFVSILLHEFSHSIVAVRGGLPIMRITLFMFGGVAQMGHEAEDPLLELRMAAAGPVMSAALAALLYGAARASAAFPFLSVLLVTVCFVNIGIFIFNMVPAFPLDGGRILRAAIWKGSGDLRKATKIAAGAGRAFAWVLISIGAVRFAYFHEFISGMWMVMIGLFLRQAAGMSYDMVALRSMLEGLKVEDLMRRDAAVADPSTDLATLVEEYFLRVRLDCIPVAAGGMLIGMVFLDDVTPIDSNMWRLTAAGEVARTGSACPTARPEDPAWTLFGPLMQQGLCLVPVTGPDGRLVGVATGRDFSALLRGGPSMKNGAMTEDR